MFNNGLNKERVLVEKTDETETKEKREDHEHVTLGLLSYRNEPLPTLLSKLVNSIPVLFLRFNYFI